MSQVKRWPNIKCGDCGADPLQPCVDLRSMRAQHDYPPRPITKKHPARIIAGRKVNVDLIDTEEL